MTDKQNESTAESKPQVVHSVQPSQVIVQADKLDEAAALLSILREPFRYVNPLMPFAIVPEKTKLQELEEYLPAPSRVRQNNIFTDVDSFLNYYGKFAPGQTPVLFATRSDKGLRIEAVLDYHANADGKTLPKWGHHIAVLQLAYDPDFAAWMLANGKYFEQIEFAEFVEDYTHAFVDPDGATMLELAQELKGHRNAQFGSGQRLGNGQIKLEYSEEINATTSKGDMRVPENIKLNMQIFAHIPAQDLLASFRWRLGDDKKVKFAFKFLQLRAAVEKAMDEVVAKVEETTAQKVLYVSQAKSNAPGNNNF